MALTNIIFDFGGVICNIDISLTEQAFLSLGFRKSDNHYPLTEKETFFEKFETGLISPEMFRQTLKSYFDRPVTGEEIDTAWNALLLDIPESRIRLLKKLRMKYRLFLLSNTNQIHFEHYLKGLQETYGFEGFHNLFEKAYFSHQIRLRKPSREVFEFVIEDSAMVPGETLFIDDSIQHIQGARMTGLLAYHLQPGEDITDLFSPEMQFLRSL